MTCLKCSHKFHIFLSLLYSYSLVSIIVRPVRCRSHVPLSFTSSSIHNHFTSFSTKKLSSNGKIIGKDLHRDLRSRNYISPKSSVHGQGKVQPAFVSSRSTNLLTSIRGGSQALQAVSSETSTLTSDHEYNQTSVDIGSSPLSDLVALLQTNTTTGLSSEEATKRLKMYGANNLVTPKGKSLLDLILEQFDDRLVQILLAVAALSGIFSYFEMQAALLEGQSESILKSFVEPIVILSILILNATVGVWQGKSAEGSLEALKRLQPSLASVQRDGKWIENVDAKDLVPGDIISFRVGDKISADARILTLQSSSMSVDEGSLTGESVTVQKLQGDEGLCEPNSPVQDMKGVVFSGTMVTSGTGTAMVVRTGMNTEIGKIQQGVTDAKEDDHKTPLGIKLDEFGETLTSIIGVICVAVWIISIPKFSDPSFSSVFEGAIYYAKVSVALGVAAIPEGLPAVITLCLSLGTRRMAQRNVIVRKLPSVETLGCTSVICTDKTGTLTTNEMTAVSLVLLEKSNEVIEHSISGYSYSPRGHVVGISPGEEISKLPHGAVSDCAAVAALCNDARIIGHDLSGKKEKKAKGKITDAEKEYERVGEPTEAALCILSEKLGGLSHISEDETFPSKIASANVDKWRSSFPRSATLEFNRDRKSMSVLCRPASNMNGRNSNKIENRLLVKGAPSMLIQRCTHVKNRDGTVMKLTGELRRAILAKTSELATRPLRCLALAVRENAHLDRTLKSYAPNNEANGDGTVHKHPLLSDTSKYIDIESGLVLVGIVGIKDPARPEVAESIKDCSKAGIRVMMITGDARDTAIAIARDVNIFPPKDECDDNYLKAFEGREFFEKSYNDQLEILKDGNIVFCRAEPSDKQKLVKMLQSLHEISAMTGDGVNDAPALQQSDIGVAMGITGTEVSKEAADMILADDNFSTIVSAVEEGRCIYANMQAFICFLISCNIGEICAILLATIAGVPEPLTAMHLLWVNLVTDGPPATALGFNPPAPDLMEQSPRPSDEPIMTSWLLTRYCVTGLYVGIATVGIFIYHYLNMGLTFSQLSSWSKCGHLWTPSEPMLDCSELFTGDSRMLPQTLSLTTLVCMEMFKALSAVSVDNSIFVVGPQKNPWLILGVAVPMLLHLAVVYSDYLGIPGLGQSFGIVSLSSDDWINVLKWSAPILIVEEILKFIGRSIIKKKENRERKGCNNL
mmetsp:Transcript_19664/g.27650  ORF Transcript_19664/g.27650 Transcript_19664/m.27650 type:complete len:1196 (-) Transcript_19664:95-3682(-)